MSVGSQWPGMPIGVLSSCFHVSLWTAVMADGGTWILSRKFGSKDFILVSYVEFGSMSLCMDECYGYAHVWWSVG